MVIKVRHKDNQVALSFVGAPTVIRAQTDAEMVASAAPHDANGVDIKYSVDNAPIVLGFPFDGFQQVTNHKNNISASMGSNRDDVVTALNAIFAASDQALGTIKNIDGITLTGIQDGQVLTFDQSQSSFVNSTISTNNLSSADLSFSSARAHSLNARLGFTLGQTGGLFTVTTNDGLTNRIHIDNNKILLNGLEMPSSDGTAGQVLKTNGSGDLSFTTIQTSLASDTTPELGGDLDVNDQKITSSGNGDVVIDPAGSGAIVLKSDNIRLEGAGTITTPALKLHEIGVLEGNFIAIKPPLTITSDVTLTLPDGAGSAGQALKTNGSGTLSWGDVVSSVNPTISGALKLVDPSPTLRGKILFEEQGGGSSVSLVGPASLSSNVEFTLPDSDGASGAFLKTDGSGTLSFGFPATPKDGWHGSTTRIKLLPRDFIADDGGRPMMIDDSGTNSFFLESHGSNPAYASIEIPSGFKATAVKVNGSATDSVEVFEMQIDSSTPSSKGTGNVGTEINITDVTSSSTNYLLLKVANASGNEIHGGYVTISAV